ncbi:MAG: hypothetical protein KAT43_00360 [Nanoarchaeota archaeon]|nr:hypothetical protein [Nanoarchaeota archaeon]
MKIHLIAGVLLVFLLVLSTGALAITDYHKYNVPAEKEQYEERYIEVPSYSGKKVFKAIRSKKWTPTSTSRFGTYGPEKDQIEPVLKQPIPVRIKKIPARLIAQTEKPQAKTFTGKRTGRIVRLSYNGRYDYGFIKKDNSAFKFGFVATHEDFNRYDHVKFDLKKAGKNQMVATNLVLIK